MCRSARLHILGAEAEERSDEAHDAVLCEGLCPPLIATRCRGHGRPRHYAQENITYHQKYTLFDIFYSDLLFY